MMKFYCNILERLRIVVIISFFCIVSIVSSQEKSDTLEVYFRQGYSLWEPNFKNNGKRLEAFVERFKKLRKDTVLYNISKIHIIAGCSPEGRWELNQRLSKNRAKRIRTVLKNYISLPDSVIVEDSRGINWKGLEELVEASDMEYKDEVLNILHTAPEYVNKVEARKLRLAYLRDGKPWEYMYKHFFPILRSFNLQIVIEWEKVAQHMKIEPVAGSIDSLELKKPEMPALSAPVQPIFTPEVSVVDELPPFYMAAKTNMLYDLAMVPNVGVEFYLGKNYSLSANWMYSWWKKHTWHWFWRTYGGDIEVRKWFGEKAQEKPLQGWHAGVYTQMITYDFETGGRGYLGDRWTWGGGVSIGYSMPIKRRLNLDFTLGLGYLGGEYKEYLPIDDCYVWQTTKNRRWFGPTKLEVTLVWLLGRGNYNAEEGGEK